jgi:hypothetical protein
LSELILCDRPNYHVTVIVTGGVVVCRNCSLTGCAVYAAPGDALAHLLRHIAAGERVRRGVLEGLAVASAVLNAQTAKSLAL